MEITTIQNLIIGGLALVMLRNYTAQKKWNKETKELIEDNRRYMIQDIHYEFIDNKFKDTIEKIHARIGGLNKKVDRKSEEIRPSLDYIAKQVKKRLK